LAAEPTARLVWAGGSDVGRNTDGCADASRASTLPVFPCVTALP
jgi:hypothetical protein